MAGHPATGESVVVPVLLFLRLQRIGLRSAESAMEMTVAGAGPLWSGEQGREALLWAIGAFVLLEEAAPVKFAVAFDRAPAAA